MKAVTKIATALLTMMLAIAAASTPAHAKEQPAKKPVAVSWCQAGLVRDDLGIVPDVIEADGVYDARTKAPLGETIRGGKVQHTDPTRHDYVPLGSAGDPSCPVEMQPMSATGWQYISAFPFEWQGLTIPIPKGQLTHSVNGSGLTVTAEGASYVVAGAPCNVQFQFQNRYGSTVYSTIKSPIYGCGGYFEYINPTDRTLKRGLLCARLYVNGYFKGEMCHSIVP